MIITIKKLATQESIDKMIAEMAAKGIEMRCLGGVEYRPYGLIGDTSCLSLDHLKAHDIVETAMKISEPYKKASRRFHPQDTIIEVGGIKIGGNEKIAIMAGPCSIEGEDHFFDVAKHVQGAGACMLRGGAYKPRTSPYAFQGLEKQGIDIMCEARENFKMPIVSELMSIDKLDEFVEHVDIIQIGTRNMQNFDLLKKLGKIRKPILLKRGFANTIEEWLMSAEYIMAGGNEQVMLCERGIRTFEKYTRNTLDLSVIPIIKQRSHLPIIIDPSHATGDWSLVESMSLAAIAAGADGLIIEVHDEPEKAMSDGPQSLKYKNFEEVIRKGKQIAKVIGRDM
ncbi:MAG: 3-deoxy-7-phosphoheptulonate synthase [Clostridia bacterium]